MQRGVIDRFRSMPMARSAVLAGATLADLVRNLFVILLMAAVGYAIGFRSVRRPGGRRVNPRRRHVRLLAQLDLRLRRAGSKGPEAAQSAGFIAIFPLVFASSIFVPIDTMPSWLQTVANVSPVTAAPTRRASSRSGHHGQLAVAGAGLDRRHPPRVRPALRAQVPPAAITAAGVPA